MSIPQEFRFSERQIMPSDLEQVLASLKPGEECVISFTDVNIRTQDFESLRQLFQKIVKVASRLVLIADPEFEVLGQGIESTRLHFVNKPGFSVTNVQGTDFDTTFVSLIESFWAHYFPDIRRVAKAHSPIFRAEAAVTLVRTNKHYWIVLRMNREGLDLAAERILQFTNDGGTVYPPADMVAEVLNILCGLLKPLLRLRKFEAQIEVGIPVELPREGNPQEGPNVYHWSFEISPNAYFEIALNEEVSYVSA